MVPPGSCAFLARLSCARQVTRNGKITINLLSTHLRCLSVTRHPLQNVTTNNAQDESQVSNTEKMSKAMKAYLERAKKHDEFMAKENVEFNIGKRHLANMMGMNPETLTQADIDNCIEYLFPSGLYEPRARPLMRPPKEVFPQRKAAEFDASGRPYHSMFYTSKPNYYQLLYDIVTAIKECDKREDAARRQNIAPETLDVSSSIWVSLHELEQMLYEELSEKQHSEFVQTMERLLQHPFAFVAKDFMLNYRKPLSKQTDQTSVPKPEYDADGRPYITVRGCFKKTARGVVTVRGNGTGQIMINGQDILYFTDVQAREQYSRVLFGKLTPKWACTDESVQLFGMVFREGFCELYSPPTALKTSPHMWRKILRFGLRSPNPEERDT